MRRPPRSLSDWPQRRRRSPASSTPLRCLLEPHPLSPLVWLCRRVHLPRLIPSLSHCLGLGYIDLYAPDIPERIAKHPPHWPQGSRLGPISRRRISLTGRQILLRFHERSTTHFVAQIQAPPSTCSARTAAPAVTRSWAANRA